MGRRVPHTTTGASGCDIFAQASFAGCLGKPRVKPRGREPMGVPVLALGTVAVVAAVAAASESVWPQRAEQAMDAFAKAFVFYDGVDYITANADTPKPPGT